MNIAEKKEAHGEAGFDTKILPRLQMRKWMRVGELLVHYGEPCHKCGKRRKVTLCDRCYGHGEDDV